MPYDASHPPSLCLRQMKVHHKMWQWYALSSRMGASELVSDKESADACACVLEMMVISIGLALTSSVVVCAVDVHRCAVFFFANKSNVCWLVLLRMGKLLTRHKLCVCRENKRLMVMLLSRHSCELSQVCAWNDGVTVYECILIPFRCCLFIIFIHIF